MTIILLIAHTCLSLYSLSLRFNKEINYLTNERHKFSIRQDQQQRLFVNAINNKNKEESKLLMEEEKSRRVDKQRQKRQQEKQQERMQKKADNAKKG